MVGAFSSRGLPRRALADPALSVGSVAVCWPRWEAPVVADEAAMVSVGVASGLRQVLLFPRCKEVAGAAGRLTPRVF